MIITREETLFTMDMRTSDPQTDLPFSVCVIRNWPAEAKANTDSCRLGKTFEIDDLNMTCLFPLRLVKKENAIKAFFCSSVHYVPGRVCKQSTSTEAHSCREHQFKGWVLPSQVSALRPRLLLRAGSTDVQGTLMG